MVAKFDQLDAMQQEEESAQEEDASQDDEDEFSTAFSKLKIDTKDADVEPMYVKKKALQALIKDYKALRYKNRPEAKQAINLLRFRALLFFVTTIEDERVLSALFRSITSYPDKAIKLYFLCLEHDCMHVLDEDFMNVVEDVIKDAIRFHGDKFNLRFLHFYRHWKTHLPMLDVRFHGGGPIDCYDDVSND